MILSFIILVVGLFIFGNSDDNLGILGAVILAPFVILVAWWLVIPAAFIWLIYSIFKYKI